MCELGFEGCIEVHQVEKHHLDKGVGERRKYTNVKALTCWENCEVLDVNKSEKAVLVEGTWSRTGAGRHEGCFLVLWGNQHGHYL